MLLLTQVVTESVSSQGLPSPGSCPTELPKVRRKPGPQLRASSVWPEGLFQSGLWVPAQEGWPTWGSQAACSDFPLWPRRGPALPNPSSGLGGHGSSSCGQARVGKCRGSALGQPGGAGLDQWLLCAPSPHPICLFSPVWTLPILGAPDPLSGKTLGQEPGARVGQAAVSWWRGLVPGGGAVPVRPSVGHMSDPGGRWLGTSQRQPGLVGAAGLTSGVCSASDVPNDPEQVPSPRWAYFPSTR